MNEVRRFLIIVFLSFSSCLIYGQSLDNNTIEIFNLNEGTTKSKSNTFSISANDLKTLKTNDDAPISIVIPNENRKIKFRIQPYKLLSDNFKLSIDNQDQSLNNISAENSIFYHGLSTANENSYLSLSIINDQLHGSFSVDGVTKELVPSLNKSSEIAFEIIEIKNIHFGCGTSDIETQLKAIGSEQKSKSKTTKSLVAPVEIYVETTYQTYLDHGSTVSGVQTFVLNLFNAVAAIYNNINVDIQVNVSNINVYTSSATDPYYDIFSDMSLSAGQMSSLALNAMPCIIGTSYNGRLAHLIHSTTGNSSNGIAQVPGGGTGCNITSAIYGTSTVYDNSIASQYLVAHEIGHNFSSPHTHDCFWNGNNTPIDGCSTPSPNYNGGTCSQPANMSGTIMSYCSNNNNMFHPQVISQITNFVDNCLLPINSSCPAVEEVDLTITYPSTTSAEITYNPNNANFLFVYYRLEGTSNWTCHNGCSSSGTTLIITGLQAGQNYEIAPLVICTSGGQSPSTFSCPIIINTDPTPPTIIPDCTHTGNITINTQNPDAIIFTDGAFIKTQTLPQPLIPLDNTHWRATDYVELLPNFEVPLNQMFEISIGPCN